jgi:tripartite-type tricarboxylate transporter receptor subunit TctC
MHPFAITAGTGTTVIRVSLTRRLLAVGVVMSLMCPLLEVAPAFAQTYPDRRVSFIVGYEPGGTGDAVGRIIVRGLSETLGLPMVVENRAGASGSIAAQGVARASPDGYTILVGQSAEIAINQHYMGGLSYEPEKELVPIALGGIVPLGLVVPARSPFASLAELLKAANKSKGLLFASAGPGTPGHFAGELLRQKTNGNMTHVPYKGAGPALNDLLGSHVDLYFSGLPAALPLWRSGQVKLLAVSSAERAASSPDTPTVAEAANIPGFDITLWVGFFAPRGTPAEVVTRLNQAINAVLALPETKERLGDLGVEVRSLSPAELAAFVKAESAKYAQIIKQGDLHN